MMTAHMIQSGTVWQSWWDTQHPFVTQKGPRVEHVNVKFNRVYDIPPNVVTSLNKFDISKHANGRLVVEPVHIGRDQFTIKIYTWEDSIVYGVGVTWIAYPA